MKENLIRPGPRINVRGKLPCHPGRLTSKL